MQVATLFRESATLLGAQMMESPSSCSSSSSAASSIASTLGTISQASELSSTSTINMGPLLEESQTNKLSSLQPQQRLNRLNQHPNLDIVINHEDKKNMHEHQNNQPSQFDHSVHQQMMHQQNLTMHNHMLHNQQRPQNISHREQHQHPPLPLQNNYRSVLDFIAETKKTDTYHHSHQNVPPPNFVEHQRIRHFEEDEEKTYEHLPNPNLRNQEPNQDDGYETGGALSDMCTNQQISMNTMLPNNYHYMMSSRNMQIPHPSLPKMEYNQSRHGQTTPLTSSGISDDPYRFVDDELSSSTQTIVSGMGNSLSTQNQMMPNYTMGSEGSILTNQQVRPNDIMQNFIPNDAITGNNLVAIKEPKKRGRKKKIKDDNCSSVEGGIEISRPIKERKKHDRFNGMSEEEVSQRFLPDHISENLDIVIIGINPGLFAAYKGHHYAGPGNHFWKCLYLSGLTNEQMTADEDYKLLHCGIGFTNMVQRPTKGSADLTRKEIKEGCLILLEKLRKYQPKIAVFNGKLIFEVFSGKKDFAFGKQTELIEGTQTHMWVMPSSSARCAQLPRAADKVPFYASLKKFRDYLNGHVKNLDESEFVFNDPKLKAICDVSLDQLKIDNTSSILFGNEINESGLMDPRSEGMQDDPLSYQNNKMVEGNIIMSNKKKRGRPKKVKGDGDETLIKIPRRTAIQSYDNEYNDDGTQRKKRGRPKKSKQNHDAIKIPETNCENKEGMLVLPPINNMNHRNGILENNDGQINSMPMNQNPSLISRHEQNNFLTHPQHMQRIMHHDQSENGFMHQQMKSHSQEKQQHQPIHVQQHLQHNYMQQQHHHQHQQQHPQILPHIHQQPMHSLTPPINMRYNTPSRSTPNSNSNASSGQNFQNSPQHHTTPTFSDLSSEISAAISSDHMGDSPTPSLGQTDFETAVSLNSDNTSNVYPEIAGVGPLSKENKHQTQHTPPTNFRLAHLQSSHSIDSNSDANRSYSPYRTPNYTPDIDHQTHQIQQQRTFTDNFILNRSLVSSPLPSHQCSSEQMQQQKAQQQQQSQQHHHHHDQQQQHHQLTQLQQPQTLGNTTDVASKSLSGLENLVDQIPSIGEHNISGGGTISPVSHNNTSGTNLNSSSSSETEKIVPPATSLTSENSQFTSNSCLYSSGYSSGALVPPTTSTTLLTSNAYPISSASSSFTTTPPGLLTNTYGSSVPATIPSHFSVSSLTTPNYHPSTTGAAFHSTIMNPLVHHHGPTLFSVPVSPLYHPHAYQHSGYTTAYQPPTLHMPSPNYPYGYPPTNTYANAPGTPSYHPMFDRHLKPDLGYGGF